MTETGITTELMASNLTLFELKKTQNMCKLSIYFIYKYFIALFPSDQRVLQILLVESPTLESLVHMAIFLLIIVIQRKMVSNEKK